LPGLTELPGKYFNDALAFFARPKMYFFLLVWLGSTLSRQFEEAQWLDMVVASCHVCPQIPISAYITRNAMNNGFSPVPGSGVQLSGCNA